MRSALFKPMEYSDCRAEKPRLSGLAALLSQKASGAGDTAGLWRQPALVAETDVCRPSLTKAEAHALPLT